MRPLQHWCITPLKHFPPQRALVVSHCCQVLFHPNGTSFVPHGAPYVLEPAVESALHALLVARVRAGVRVHLLRVAAPAPAAGSDVPSGALGPLVDPASPLARRLRSAAVVVSPYSPFLNNLLFAGHRAGANATTGTPPPSAFNASPVLIEINQPLGQKYHESTFRSTYLQLCAAVGMRYWLVEHNNFSYTSPMADPVNETVLLEALESAGVLAQEPQV